MHNRKNINLATNAKKISKRFTKLLLICCLLLFLTGCWDQIELNNLAIISGEGIDITEDGEIELSLEVIMTAAIGSADQGGLNLEKFTTVRSGIGKTFADAINDVERKFPRQLFPGHTRAFVIGEEAAKAGIGDHIDFIVRYPESRLRSYVFVSKGSAKDALVLLPPIEGRTAEVIRKMAGFEYGVAVTVKELAQMLHSETGDAVLPLITKLPAGPGYDDIQTIEYINGAAIFKKDRMVKMLDYETALGLQWVRWQIGARSITVAPKNTEGYVSLWLIHATGVELKPSLENGKWKVIIAIEGTTEVIQNTTKLNMRNPDFLKLVSEAVADKIESKISMTLVEIQEVEADVVGFAEAFRRKYPKEWAEVKDNWGEIFAEIEVDYDINIDVARQGMSNPPVGIPADEVIEE